MKQVPKQRISRQSILRIHRARREGKIRRLKAGRVKARKLRARPPHRSSRAQEMEEAVRQPLTTMPAQGLLSKEEQEVVEMIGLDCQLEGVDIEVEQAKEQLVRQDLEGK